MKPDYAVEDIETQWDNMRAGSTEAMLVLYEGNYSDLLSYGVQLSNSVHTSKDAINDVFLHLWEQHTKLKPVANVKAYLFACIRRKIFHQLYTDKTQLLTDMSPEDTEMPYEDVLIAMQRSEEIRKKVQAAIKKLTDRQKELIHLRYFKNMDYEEIEQVTGMSLKTAYNTVYSAVKTLTSELRNSVLATLLLILFSSK